MKALLSFYMLSFFLGYSCNEIGKEMERERKQIEQNVQNNIETYITSCWNQNDVGALNEITTSEFVRTLNGIKVVSSQNEMKAHLNVFARGFPDMEVSLDNMYLIEDRAFLKWHFTGSNSGVYGEFPPTHKKVKVSGLSQISFDSHGLLLKEDTYFNELSLLQQLGYHLSPPAGP